MTTHDPIRAALERLIKLDDAHEGDRQWEPWVNAIAAARAALAAAPEGEPSDQELRDLWSWSSGQDQGPWPTQYHCFARAVLSRWGRPAALAAAPEGEGPSDEELKLTYARAVAAAVDAHLGALAQENVQAAQLAGLRAVLARWGSPNQEQIGSLLGAAATPPAPLEGEVGELVSLLRAEAVHDEINDHMAWLAPADARRAATLLEQLSAAAPAVVPIPVSERLPEPEDCDAEGRCWWSAPESDKKCGIWCLAWGSRLLGATHWLPAHAIPLPAPQAAQEEA